MSSGFILDKPSPPSEVFPPPRTPIKLSAPALLGFVPKFVLSIGMPFTTVKGLFCPEIELCPLILIFEVPAGPVPKGETFTPAICPYKAFIKLGVRFSVIASRVIEETEHPNFFAFF